MIPEWIKTVYPLLAEKQDDGFVNLLTDIEKYPEMVKRATNGFYSDFGSPIATPITVLVSELNQMQRTDLTEKAINGEYDHDKVRYR